MLLFIFLLVVFYAPFRVIFKLVNKYLKLMGENDMKGKIGFIKTDYVAKETENKWDTGKMEIMARKSVVQVYFPDRGASYAYYNDQFDLKCGDIVFVEGKLEGLRGRVTDVNYNFKIKLSDYKRVISVADANVKGEFYMAGSHLVTFDENALPKNKVVSWFKAPIKEEDEFVSGSDETTFSIDDLSGMNISIQIAERGHDYYASNQVCYICIDGNQGYAIVEGSEAYEVEFEYHNREIRNLICSCYCSYNCKHEFAAMLQLKETLDLIEKKYEDTYKETGYFAAISKVMMFKMVVDGKKEGKLVL